jgi:hypothetical protein
MLMRGLWAEKYTEMGAGEKEKKVEGGWEKKKRTRRKRKQMGGSIPVRQHSAGTSMGFPSRQSLPKRD